MNAIKLFMAKYALLLALGVGAVLSGALAVQTVRLSAAQRDVAIEQANFAQYVKDAAERRAKDERLSRTTEQQLANAAATTRKQAHEKERALTARVNDLRDQLRNRPERPAAGSPVAPVASAQAGNTGAGLYRQDGEFLTGEAATAAQIAIERDACYIDYNAAREALKGQQK